MISTDLHMHSTYSLDGSNTIAELCEQALALGLTHIAVTDHVEWLPDGSHQRPDFDRYFDEMRTCQQQYAMRGLTLLTGLELGNPHEHRAEVDALLASHPFDVVIGSLHWLNGQNIHFAGVFAGRDPYDVVIGSLHWLNGQNIHFAGVFAGRDPYDVYSLYFDAIAQVAASVDCGIIAHFDRIFWPGSVKFGLPQIARVERAVRRAMQTIVAHGCVLELNTRFLTHAPNWSDSLLQVLRWYREEGGAFVAVNSDAHRTAEIGRNRHLGEELVIAAGCTPYTWRRQTESDVALFGANTA